MDTTREFKIGRVIGRAQAALSANFKPYFMLSLMLVGVPYFLFNLTPLGTGSFAMATPSGLVIIAMLIALIALIVGSVVTQNALIDASVSHEDRAVSNMQPHTRYGLSRFFPVFGLSIVAGIGIMLGMLLLVIPGVILALMWCVAVPAMLNEKISIGEALGRSAELTKGSRFGIFGLMLIFVVAVIILSFLVMALFGFVAFAITGATGGDLESLATSPTGLYVGLNALFNALVQAFTVVISAVVYASLYNELRFVKEGVTNSDAVNVFD